MPLFGDFLGKEVGEIFNVAPKVRKKFSIVKISGNREKIFVEVHAVAKFIIHRFGLFLHFAILRAEKMKF